MAISSAGVGSGLNVQSIVSQLVAVESQPVKLLQAKGSTLQTKLSVFGQVKSELASLQDAASALISSSTWDSKSFTSSATANVTGTISANAMVGTFKVDVGNLATSQTLKFNAFSPAIDPSTPANALPNGKLTFQLGTWSGAAFANKTNADSSAVPSVDVEVKSTDTLATLASRINSSNAGVNAVVVTNGTTQQLVLRGSSTGTSNGFTVSATAGLEQFQYNTTPLTASSPPAPTYTGAGNANLTIEGVPVISQSNTVANAVPGVTLNLLTPNSSTNITVATDKDAIKAKMQAFQDAYNKLYSDLKTQTAYNSATKTGGPLLGDNTATSMMGMLRNLAGAAGPTSSGTQLRLSDLGLEIQSDGSLKTNSTKLDAALQDPANVKSILGKSTGTTTGNGIAKGIYDFAFGALASGGTVNIHNAAFQKAIDRNNDTIDKFNTHIAAYQKQLLAQYNALDTNMAKLNSLSAYVTQQVTTWNKSG